MPAIAPIRLRIKDIADATGVAAATIRMWEQRHGFPNPDRTPSGYRLYTAADVEAIRTVTALRHRGVSVADAIAQVKGQGGGDVAGHLSIYAAVAAVDPAAHPRVLRRSTLVAISEAIEDELLARGSRGFVVGAFQRTEHYAKAAHRYEQIARFSEATVVFADFSAVRVREHAPTEVPIAPSDALGNEWAVVIDTPDYSATLLAWERPNTGGDRVFEAVLSLDPRAARRAAGVAAWLAGRHDPELGGELAQLIRRRPVSPEPLASTLTSLTNRMASYLDARAA